MIKTILRWLLALFFLAAGWNHFRSPQPYLAIIPPYLPWPELMVAISGAAEMAGGLGLLLPLPRPLRRAAGIGLIALLLAIFPANLHMALQNAQPAGWNLPPWLLWSRLPLQGVLIAAVWWVALHDSRCYNEDDERSGHRNLVR